MKGQPPVSSKLPSRRSKNEFYRYYAGYPLSFAEWAIQRLELSESSRVIDPWNGSGTTAAACAHLGISCQGYDISPVMVHLGRARVASDIDFDEALELIAAVEEQVIAEDAINLKAVGLAFRGLPVTNERAHSVAIAALFPYARSLLTLSRTKNPSWFKKGATLEGLTVSRGELFALWRHYLTQVSLWRSTKEDLAGVAIAVDRGDSRKSLGRRETFDGFLTSPPYLTRLDYVQATLPEFLILEQFDTVPDIFRLRRSMLGSPLTSDRPLHSVDRLPDGIRALLSRIERHPSKASSTYYRRFFTTYFVDLHASLRNITRVLKGGAQGCLVVQSSNYKEIKIDLAEVVILLAEDVGLCHQDTIEFDNRRSMSLVNSRAHAEARKPKSESAVFFRRK